MEQLYVLGALGAVILGIAAWGLIDDDDNDGGAETVGVNEIDFDGSTEINGTDGQDNVAAGQNAALAPETINLGTGNDTASVGYPTGIAVFGEDGDDILEATAEGNRLWGQSGNDALSAVDGNILSGQEGNDVLTLNAHKVDGATRTDLDGGEGNDIINIVSDAGIDWGTEGVTTFEGAAGNDTFNVVLTVQDSTEAVAGEDGGDFITDLGKITDFNPAQDKLTVDIKRADGLAARDYTLGFDQTEADDGTFVTDMSFIFAGTDTATLSTSTLRVISSSAFTADDVDFVSDKPSGTDDTVQNALSFGETETLSDGTKVLEGTLYDDVLATGQDAALAPDEVILGEGNDKADIDISGIIVRGGLGDDTLSSEAVDTSLWGGQGDDEITGIESNTLSGFEGNDVITLNDRGSDGVEIADRTFINGGDGDDTINIVSDTNVDTQKDIPITVIDGGAGQDIFNLKINLTDFAPASLEDDMVTESNLGKIMDFDPAEDTMNIEITRAADLAAREFTVELEERQGKDDQYRTDVILKFPATDTAVATTSTIRVISGTTAGITLDNINFTGLKPTVPAVTTPAA